LLSLKAIFSRSLKSAQETAQLIDKPDVSPDLYSTDSGSGKGYDDLLQRPDISGVILALPIMDQPKYVKAALAAGKHVLAEKPIAPDVDSAKKLIEYSKKMLAEKGVTFAIAENFRFLPSYALAKDEIKKLGRITNFSARLFYMVKQEGMVIWPPSYSPQGPWEELNPFFSSRAVAKL
jgi:predicted dehydrogenase